MSSIIETLTEINLNDLVVAFGWQDHPLLSRTLRRLFVRPARTLAYQVADFDAMLAERGLVEAARATVRRYVRDLRVFGAERIPPSGFLALSNHPGLTDALALFTALNRPDLHIIALGRPFLDALTNMSKQLFYLRDESASRLAFVRQVAAHLRNGGAVLTFPAGRIEPDPDVHDGAIESLRSWTDSAGVFIRLAQDTAILPVLVRGVVWEKTAHHWLTRFKRTKDEKDRLAAALQVIAHVILKTKPVSVRVQIGNPIYAKEVGTTDTRTLHQAVLTEMKQLLKNPPQDNGLSLL